MILLKNKDKKANIKIGNNIEIKDGSDFPFDLTLYGRSTQATRSGKNLFTKQGNATPKTDTTFWNNITHTTPESDGWCKVSVDNTNGTTTVFANQFTKRNTIDKLEVNKTYSILVEVRNLTMSGSSSTPPYLQLCETAKDSVWQSIQNYDLAIFKETNKAVFQKLTKTNFDSSLLDFRNFVSVPKGYKVEFEYRLMVVKGSYTLDTIGEYEPYGVMPSPDYPSPIESITEISATVTGKNLLPNTATTKTISGLTFTKNEDGTILVNGTASANINFDVGTIDNLTLGNTYHLCGCPSGGTSSTYRLFMSDITTGSTSEFGSGSNYTIQNTKVVVRIIIQNGTTVNNLLYKPMVSTDTTLTYDDYEQYKSNSLTIDLQGNELCSLPNGTKDELVIENGEALLTKRIGKVVLNGSENWIKLQIGITGKYYFKYTPSDLGQVTSNPSVLSNYFVQSTTWSEQSVGIWFDTNLIIKTEGSLNNTETVDEFKTWLSTHNVKVLYELAEPETINLGTVEMPHTYNGVSNIANSADTEMIVKYYKKFEFDKILRSGYNIDEQEYEIAKKQMANGKRKKILSSYVDCIIKIDLGLLDNKTYQEYKEQLEDGEYEYWSYKYNQYKKANFILTKPSITTEYAYDDDIGIDDMEITLEKSSDVS